VTDHKRPLDKLLDVVVFAPIGLALNVEEMVDQMATRGRQSVNAARFIGRMAVTQGRTEVDKALVRLQDQAAGVLDQLGAMAGGSGTSPSPPPPKTPTTFSEVVAEAEPDRGTRGPSDGSNGSATATAISSAEDDAAVNAAIPDFDSLAASQVVPRLAGLASDDLEAVRRYEAAHRGRKTILHRIAQLQQG
jgi:hypothetical protein